MNTFEFTVKDLDGNEFPLSNYQGKTLLIVNTATQCGFTPQYKALQELYEEYGDKEFEILDFPCDQFGHQAPGSNEEISSFCEMKYKTTFPRFSKIDVNGENADPLFVFLRKNSKGILGDKIKWNFTKFLIGKDGNVIDRYAPITDPAKIAKDIEKVL